MNYRRAPLASAVHPGKMQATPGDRPHHSPS